MIRDGAQLRAVFFCLLVSCAILQDASVLLHVLLQTREPFESRAAS